MAELTKEYYAIKLGVDPNKISEIETRPLGPEKANYARLDIVKYRDGRPETKVLNKWFTQEIPNADFYAEASIKFSNLVQEKVSPRFYRTPKFIDHRWDDSGIMTFYIDGDSLEKKLKNYKTRVKENEKILLSELKKELIIQNLKIKDIKKAYIRLALRGLAENHHYSNESIKDLEEVVAKINSDAKINLKIINPIEENNNYYSDRVIEKIKKLFKEYEIKYNATKLKQKLTSENGKGENPLSPILETIKKESNELNHNDYVPRHIIIISNPTLENEIESFIKEKHIERPDLAVCEKIVNEGKILITDSDDAQKAPELFDVVDLLRNPECELFNDESDDFLRYYVREQQSFKGGDVGPKLYEDFSKKFGIINTYRSLRFAAREKDNKAKLFCLKDFMRELNYYSTLAPLNEIIGEGIENIIETLKKDSKN